MFFFFNFLIIVFKISFGKLCLKILVQCKLLWVGLVINKEHDLIKWIAKYKSLQVKVMFILNLKDKKKKNYQIECDLPPFSYIFSLARESCD